MRLIYQLFILAFIASCNVAEQSSVDDELSNLKTQSFDFNLSSLELVQNTTYASILPLQNLDSVYYEVEPTLPSGLRINPNSGEIFGTADTVQVSTEYIVKATHIDGIDYAYIDIEVLAEPPKTLNYSVSTLTFTLNGAGTSYPITSSTGGVATSYTVTPALSAGLSLNTATGEISGTPTVTNTEYYTITASNSTGSATLFVHINVLDEIPAGLSYNDDAQIINVGNVLTTMTPVFTTTPNSATYSIRPSLPTGLVLNTTNGEISGIPTGTNGVSVYTVTAYNTAGSTSGTATITVNNPASDIDYGITEREVQQGVRIQPITITNYTGSTPVTFTADADLTTLGLDINATTGAITGTSSAALNTYTVTITATNASGATSVDIDFKVVEDYPDDGTLGYNTTYTFFKGVPISDYCEDVSLGGSSPDFTITTEAACIAAVDREWSDADNSATTVQPNTTNGTATSFSVLPGGTGIAGLGFDTTTGIIAGTPSGIVAPTVITITGSNLDETSSVYSTAVQSITVEVKDLAPTELGYLNTPGSPFYDPITEVFALQDGNNTPLNILPNITTGKGIPDSYSISPQLPDGLTINPTTGEITGTPSEIVPLKYYSITGTNTAGSHTESIAISTNTLIAPQSLSYGGILPFTIFTFTTYAPTYVGSQGTYTITPSLPAGLILNPNTGVISGAPIEAQSDGTNDEKPVVYTVTVTNSLGSAEDNAVTIQITNIDPLNLIYTDATDTELNIGANIFSTVEGTPVLPSLIKHSSDYENASPRTGFITSYTYSDNLGGGALTNFGLDLDPITGDITGTAVAVDATSMAVSDHQIQVTISGTTDKDPTTPGTSIGAATTASTFTISVLQEEADISYENGANVLFAQGNTGTAETFTATNDGGPVAVANCAVATTSGTQSLTGAPMSFNTSSCDISYDGSICMAAKGGGEESATYTVTATNTGGATTKNITVHYYDGPSYTYNPDTAFATETLSVLNSFQSSDDNTGGASALEAPAQNVCHRGLYSLDDVNDLPTPFAFSTTTGHISSVGHNLLGRRSFTLSAVRTGTPVTIDPVEEEISVQANHIEANNSGASDFKFFAQKFDFDLDGKDDILMRNTSCDVGGCTGNNAIAMYIQSAVSDGLFAGTLSSIPALANVGAIAMAPVKYDVAKTGVIFVNDADTSVFTRSATNTENDSATIDSAGNTVGIVPMQSGTVSSFGVVLQNGTAVSIEQYEIFGATMATIVDSSTTNVSITNQAGGGITGTVNQVKYNDTNGDSFMDAVVAYTSGADTFVCVILSDGADFANTCSPRLDIPNDGTVRDIKFENIVGDALDDMIILAGDSIYVYENQNNSTVGLYQAATILPLKSSNTNLAFDLIDIDGDNSLDLLVNDIETAGELQGLTIYYHTNISGTLFTSGNTQAFSDVFNYSTSQGNTNDIEIIQGLNSKHIFHCQVDTATRNESSCGIMGAF